MIEDNYRFIFQYPDIVNVFNICITNKGNNRICSIRKEKKVFFVSYPSEMFRLL